MNIHKISLSVYFLFIILAIIANIIHNETLLLVSKPFVVPTIFFYYFVSTKKINVLFSIALFFCFIGEGIGLMNFENEIYYLIIPFFISNVLISIICLNSLEKYKGLDISVFSMIIMFGFLIYLFFAILDLFSDSDLQTQIVIYGFSLLFLSFLAFYKIMTKMSISNLCLIIFVICMIVSGIFYVIFDFKYPVIVLDIFHFSLQMLSYFFLTQFLLFSENET